jgi:hypothetical protein
MVALITPTGGRPKQIKLCAEFMRRQDYQGEVLWVIVDDVIPITTNEISVDKGFLPNWRIEKILPEEKWTIGKNTQASNLLRGVEEVKKHKVDAIFIIEDDDYYPRNYLRIMLEHLKGYNVTGQIHSIYYNPRMETYTVNRNNNHCSLFRVAFTSAVLPIFERVCQTKPTFIDMNFFRILQGKGVNLFDGPPLAIGIKGLSGRAGIGIGHKPTFKMTSDFGMNKLKSLIGEDYTFYL